MSRRIATIDILRGIAITGMVLCSGIGFSSGLPGWMFHAQTPPPTYGFDPSNVGITWVDLVFPFFLFTMGAAFPFALTKRIDQGAGLLKITGTLLKRWSILTLFALILANVYSIWSTNRPAWQVNTFQILVWISLFLSLVRLNKWLNLTGTISLCALTAVQTFWFGVKPDIYKSDVIIMILANTAIWGGLIWTLTRKEIKTRWLVIGLIAVIKAISSYAPQAFEFIPSSDKIGWLFRLEWLQYLVIVLAGSIAGDHIMKHKDETVNFDSKDITAGIIALAMTPLQLWGLYSRNVGADFAITAVAASIYFYLPYKKSSAAHKIGRMGFILLLTGIAFDPLDGGIAKEYCNLSYLLTTSGLASLFASAILIAEKRFGYKGQFLSGIGQNPMLAYTVTGLLIYPILRLTGLFQIILSTAEGSQFWGMMQGIIFTSLMMACTYIFTKLKLFWRS